MSAQASSCDRKVRYRTEETARRGLKQMRRKVLDPMQLTVYYCSRHNGWHIGNRPLSAKARRILKAECV